MSQARRKRHKLQTFIQRLSKKAERGMDNQGQGMNYFLLLKGDEKYRGTQYRGVKHYWGHHSWGDD